MATAVFPKFVLACALAMTATTPVSAQFFSDGYNFLKAIKDRDGDAVTKVLDDPGSVVVNTRDLTTGQTALHIVTERRDLAWVKFLTQKGANPNIRDKKGNTPLQIAAALGFVDGVEVLLKVGANVDEGNVAGETPLIAAVHKRDVAMVRLLLASDADPDRNDNSGRSARNYVDLMNGNSLLLSEFTKADAEREKTDTGVTYGPSF